MQRARILGALGETERERGKRRRAPTRREYVDDNRRLPSYYIALTQFSPWRVGAVNAGRPPPSRPQTWRRSNRSGLAQRSARPESLAALASGSFERASQPASPGAIDRTIALRDPTAGSLAVAIANATNTCCLYDQLR